MDTSGAPGANPAGAADGQAAGAAPGGEQLNIKVKA